MAFLDLVSKVVKKTGDVVTVLGEQAQKGGDYLADPENQAKINDKVGEFKDAVVNVFNDITKKDKSQQTEAEAEPGVRKDVTPADEDIIIKYPEDEPAEDVKVEVLQPRHNNDDEI